MKNKLAELSDFRHAVEGEVRFSEVDSFGVVHNLAYLYWVEWARTEYLFEIAGTRDSDYFSKEMPLMTVHHEIDYQASLRFADKYRVLTRVARMGDSSITFQSVVVDESGAQILTSETVMVYVDNASSEGRPIPFPPEYKAKISSFEGIK